ncbi:MAG: DNA-directed RNA polymerase sigma [Podoviridae sp. ctbj_2]|nr:MAG: DNA-directed RNA polymerase sigma [Podoviridae sp. ctbj_2]
MVRHTRASCNGSVRLNNNDDINMTNPKFKLIEDFYVANAPTFVKRYTRSAGSEAIAEDIVHNAFERALRYIDAYDEKQDLERWFSLILRNSYRDCMREERGQPTELLDEFDHQGAECDGLIRRTWLEVEKLIDKTIPAHQEILSLHFLKEYTITDISRFTEHSLSNCSQVVARFRNRVKELYG